MDIIFAAALLANSPYPNRFNIIEKIGGGGFGETFSAKDQWLDIQVAIKISNHSLENETQKSRLIEGRVVRIFEYFRTGGYLAGLQHDVCIMEFLTKPWICLHDFINQHSYKNNDFNHYMDCITIAKGVLHGIADIHGKKWSRSGRYIHSDIKPENIFVKEIRKKKKNLISSLPPAEDVAKIIDLGGVVSRSSGLIAVTPGYIPNAADLDNAEKSYDLYATAVTLVYMITGKKPSDEIMSNKSKIRNFISSENKSSGSKYIDEFTIDLIQNLKNSKTQPRISSHTIISDIERKIFEKDSLDLAALEFIIKSGGNINKNTITKESLICNELAINHSWLQKSENKAGFVNDLLEEMIQNQMLFANTTDGMIST